MIPNSQIQAANGGVLPPGLTAAGNSTIDLTDPDHLVFAGNRRTQMDMRFAKVVHIGRTRTDIGVDLWNVFNTNYATGYEDDYTDASGTWLNPNAIYPPRFVRLNFTVGF